MTDEQMWELNLLIKDLYLYVPDWIDQDITTYDVISLNQGGCASGAYMPAVTYNTAAGTMSYYGDEVLEYLRDHFYESKFEIDLNEHSWDGIAVKFLSTAVDLWASLTYDELQNVSDSQMQV